MIRVISTTESFGALEGVWKKIGDQASLRVFQTFEWCFSAWKLYLDDGINKLRILVWTQENCPETVIFPFYIDGTGSLRFLMDEHSDVCDCVYKADENHHQAYKDALEAIQHDPAIQRILLSKLDPDGEALNYFGAMLPRANIVRINSYSWLRIPRTNDFLETQVQLRSREKVRMRGICRKADRLALRILNKQNQKIFPLEHLQVLSNAMRQSGRRTDHFMTQRMLDFCKRIYDDGLAEIVELVDGDRLIVLNFLLRHGNRRLSWIFLYADQHAPTELYVKYLCEQMNQDDFIFDFGTGGYDFKLRTFRPFLRLLYRLNAPLGKRSARKELCTSFIRGVKDIVKLMIGRY